MKESTEKKVVKAEETLVEVTKAVSPEVKEEVKETAKKQAKAAKTSTKAKAAKETKATTKTTEKVAPKKTSTRKSVTKKEEIMANVTLQFDGKAYTQKELTIIAKDVWKFDLGKEEPDLKKIELYVKPEEGVCYYVFNGEITGSFRV